jgi:N4-gp56 family major capsid protein
MGTTLPADFAFEPKVWKDHIDAYFPRKLVYGAFAMSDNTLTGEPGTTINFPYFKAIGDAEEPAADEALNVDKLQDDSFSATIKEVGKAIGVRKAALRKSAAAQEKIFSQVQMQMARVIAEKVDKDLITEIAYAGNFTNGYTATAAANVMTMTVLHQAIITAFGDKANEAQVVFMHSLQYLSMLTDTTSGFIKADANDPWYNVPGFKGRIGNMALVVADTVPANANIDSKKAYRAFVCKANAFGFLTAEDYNVEADYDVLNREWVFAATQWYAVKAFHAKISADDKKICEVITTTSVAA